MQIAADVTTPQSIPGATTLTDVGTAAQSVFSQYKIIRRNGVVRVICTEPRHKQRQG